MRTNAAGKPFDRNESAACFKRRPAPIYICVLVISLSVRLKRNDGNIYKYELSSAHSRGEEEEEEEISGSIGIEYMALRPDFSQLTSTVAFI